MFLKHLPQIPCHQCGTEERDHDCRGSCVPPGIPEALTRGTHISFPLTCITFPSVKTVNPHYLAYLRQKPTVRQPTCRSPRISCLQWGSEAIAHAHRGLSHQCESEARGHAHRGHIIIFIVATFIIYNY